MKKETKSKYVIYCRKPSKSKEGRIESTKIQQKSLFDYAKKNGLEVVGVINEI